MTLSINHQNNVPAHVAEELDRLGNSDEGISMREPADAALHPKERDGG